MKTEVQKEKGQKPHPPKKEHEQGVGLELVGSPEKLIKQLIPDKEQAAYAIHQLTNEGPGHKQVQNALVLKQLAKLVKTVEKMTGSKFTAQDGHTLTSKGPKHEINIPLMLPKSTAKGIADMPGVLDEATKGPEHEILMNAVVLQVTDWVNASLADHNNNNKTA